ncbi:hypothetical protein [Bacillus cereus]|uniref:Uncharacterized protein n=1 Tax=Bacillus cereus TaxID=1396 RepID=A0A161T609_BACCE|nr:hypothetical protein [Bacillus cereus]KZD66328.1 hypothetical protein B4088_2444 [Bacillus cereus]
MRTLKMLFLTSISILSLFCVGINTHAETTHLKVHPGKIKMDERVKSGTNKHLYKYYVENDGEHDLKVSIVPSGYLESKTTELTIRKGERKYFDVNLEIPKNAVAGKKTDYLTVKSVTDENSYTVKLSAKVEYEISQTNKDTIYKSFYFIPPIIIGLFALLFLFRKTRNAKRN